MQIGTVMQSSSFIHTICNRASLSTKEVHSLKKVVDLHYILACALSIDQRKLVLSKQKFTPSNHRALQKACVTKNSFSYLHNHIHWLNFTLKGHFMLAFPERMALLTFQNPKLYHIDIPQVFVCTCHGYHSFRLQLQVLDGFIIIALEPLMTAADRRRSPGSRSHAPLVEKRRAGGKKERSAWAEIEEWDAGTAACVLIKMRNFLFYEL